MRKPRMSEGKYEEHQKSNTLGGKSFVAQAGSVLTEWISLFLDTEQALFSSFLACREMGMSNG